MTHQVEVIEFRHEAMRMSTVLLKRSRSHVGEAQANSMQASSRNQYFFFSRNIGYVTPKIMYFYYLKKYLLDQSVQKIIYLILKTEALAATH